MEPHLRDTLIASTEKAEPEPPAGAEAVVPRAESIPQAEPEPVPEPEAEPEPVPEVVSLEEEVEYAAPTDNEIREIMTGSIEREEIKHFTVGQVREWKEFGEEEIDGEAYHYGLIDYVEETSLGERTIEAKALIRNRKVEKWIWTRSDMRIE